MNNTPTLMQSEEKRTPWNQKTKTVEVDISISMSLHTEVEIPENADETDSYILEQAVDEQIVTPKDIIDMGYLYKDWIIDEFCVTP